jgi:predicted site-specific integrase-resolvase
MKLSTYAKQLGISYRTAHRLWKAGQLDAYQLPTGTVIVQEHTHPLQRVAVYARVSSAQMQGNLDTQAERLVQYCEAKGYQISEVVKEIASGVNDHRPRFLALLSDASITVIVVEHQDRATRFGFPYLETLLQKQDRRIEVVNQAENGKEDLLTDLVSIIYGFSARLYGPRRAKRKTERAIEALTKDESESGLDATGGTTSDWSPRSALGRD